MALPASGAISFNDVNVELGLSGTATISLNDAAVRTLFGVASGAISMNNGYGKTSTTYFLAGTTYFRQASWAKVGSDRFWLSGNLYSGNQLGHIAVNAVTGAIVTQFNSTSGNMSGTETLGALYHPSTNEVSSISSRSSFVSASTSVVQKNIYVNNSDFKVYCGGVFSDGRIFYAGSYSYYDYGTKYIARFKINEANGTTNVFGGYDQGIQGSPFTFFYGSVAAPTGATAYLFGSTNQRSGGNLGKTWGQVIRINSSGTVLSGSLYLTNASQQNTDIWGGAVDSAGNLYTASSTNGGTEGRITKWNSTATSVEWDIKVTGINTYAVSKLVTDSSNNVYVHMQNGSANEAHGHIIKINSSGTVQYQRKLSATVSGSAVKFAPTYHGDAAFLSADGALVFSIAYKNSFNGAMCGIAKLPLDGSKTGTYTFNDGSGAIVVTYAVTSDLTFAAGGYTVESSSYYPGGSSSNYPVSTVSGGTGTNSLSGGYASVSI